MIANKAVADLSVMLKDDKNICIQTAQWLLGMISAIGSDRMDTLWYILRSIDCSGTKLHTILQNYA